MRKEKSSRLVKGSPLSLENSTKNFYDDNEQDESEQEIGENENESSTDVHNNNNTNEMTRIPEITTEGLRTAINELKKKSNSPDSNGIRAEDIKACDDETREMVRQIFNETVKRNEVTPKAWKKVRIKVIQKRRCGKCWKLPPDLLIASVVQTVLDNTVHQILSTTRQKKKRKIRQDSEAHTRQKTTLRRTE